MTAKWAWGGRRRDALLAVVAQPVFGRGAPNIVGNAIAVQENQGGPLLPDFHGVVGPRLGG